MTTGKTTARTLIGAIAPKLAALSDDVLFGDLWERTEMSKRDRSLITVAALISLYRTNELPYHLALAQANGLTREELVEAITHLAFYAGWPAAMTATQLLSASLEALEPSGREVG